MINNAYSSHKLEVVTALCKRLNKLTHNDFKM